MFCSYCHNPIPKNSHLCEHCGKALKYGSGFPKKQISMLMLPIFIFLTFLTELSILGNFNFSPDQRSPLVIFVLILVSGIGKVILYFLYMKAFEAKKWERIIFGSIIFLESLSLLSLPHQWYEDHAFMTPAFVYGTLNPVFLIISNVFLTIFFSLRIKSHRFLWLMAIGYAFNIVSFFTADLACSYLYRFVRDFSLVHLIKQIIFMFYTEGGRFLMVLFAGTVFLGFRQKVVRDAEKVDQCLKTVDEDSCPRKKERMILALVIFLYFLIIWLSFFLNYVTYFISRSRYIYHFQYLLGKYGVFSLLGNVGTITVYILYMKLFKAKFWELIIFTFFITILYIWPFTVLYNPYHEWFAVIPLTIFLTIFLGLRLRKNGFLWLLIIGHIIDGITAILPFYLFTHYFFTVHPLGELRIVFTKINVSERLGSFFFLAFAVAAFIKLMKNKRIDMKKTGNV